MGSSAYIEIWRVAFDANFDVLRPNLAIELLRINFRRQVYINIHLVQGLIPLEHLLT